MKDTRIIYLDCLRIVATIAVIFIHVAAQNWFNISVYSSEWNIFCFFNGISRFAVPIFVMISGALFLSSHKKINIKKLYSKNILRLAIAFCFWSLLYMIFNHNNIHSAKEFIMQFLSGHYHLWFLYMIIGLYIITPILKTITKDKNTTKYFLIISLIFTFIIPTICTLKPSLTNIFNNMYFHLTLGFSCYYVAGMYLNETKIRGKIEKIIYALGIIGFIATIGISLYGAHKSGTTFDYFTNFSIFVMFEALSIFILFKNYISKIKFSDKAKNIIYNISNCCFGIFLIHVLIIEILEKFGINTLMFNPILSIPLIVIIVFVISYTLSFILTKIPVLNKYIV